MAAKKRNQRKIRKAKIAKLAQSVSDSESADEEDTAACQFPGHEKKPQVSFSLTPKISKDSRMRKEPSSSSRDDIDSDREPLTPYNCSDTECPSSDDSFSDLEVPVALKDAMKNGVNKPIEKLISNRYRLRFMCGEIPLVICYVALLCLRQNVVEIDIVRWVRSQKVPYLDMMSCLPPHMQLSGHLMHQNFRPYVRL